MGFLGKIIKAGIAQRVIDEARKPQNQQKAKDLFAQVKNKSKKR